MPRTKKIMLWSAIGSSALLFACVIFLLAFDWNHARPWINTHVSAATGRDFAINGDLALTWQRPQVSTGTWRDWVPVPRLSAHDVSLSNPDWSRSGPNMVEVGHITFSVNPLPLLNKTIVIPTLQLDDPIVKLERLRDGRNNWTFTQNAPSAWTLDLQGLLFYKGEVSLKDEIKHIDAKASIDTLQPSAANDFVMDWKLSGTFNGARISGDGKAGALLALKSVDKPFPLQARLNVGKTSIRVKGSVTKPQDLAAIDMQLHLSGASMADLYPLTGITLPKTPEFSTEGHLTGTTNALGGKWTYDKFRGKVGESDISGTLMYESKKPRPLLSGTVVSNLLRLSDLGTIIGADSNESKKERGVAASQPENKVLPVEKFTTERWGSIDADVKISGRKIIRDASLPIENLDTHLKLNDRIVTLTPLNFGVAGGNMIANIKLDGRNDIIKAEAKISARHLKLKQLFPTFQPMQASFGEINGDTSLSATGNSIASMLASSNGEIKALISEGTISKLLLEQIGLNIGNIILSELFGDKQVQLNCMASDLTVTNGIIQTRTLIVDTDDATLYVTGKIDLAQEKLDLTINPKSKGLRIVSLRTPIYVAGDFKNPRVNVDKGVLALKAGSAIVLGALAPVTALLPLVNVGSNEDNKCKVLLKEAQGKPVAPPPGKTYKGKAKNPA
ncbi:protein involved in outer membrane biogenesis asmA [Herminiimonas arsenicoxydans]|uniref:Protein involved in outer membrane biogenesis asmA n=1 Tax=Herminiimonas arsenicoxydans TaxID=204773 RepID=A4GAI7_HERAR|nr:protein involved in outer membrane biogenesis asmA [Herminiimonas arsenicoxydans]